MQDGNPRKRYKAGDVLRRLKVACANAGGATAWARENGIHRQMVYDAMAGKKPSGSLTERLGLVKVEDEWEEK